MSKNDIPEKKASLAAPTLPESANGVISLKNVPREGMKYEVPEYEGIKVDDVVTAIFGVDGDNQPYKYEIIVEAPKAFSFLVPRKVLLDLTGKNAVAVYWVEGGGVSLRTEVKVTH